MQTFRLSGPTRPDPRLEPVDPTADPWTTLEQPIIVGCRHHFFFDVFARLVLPLRFYVFCMQYSSLSIHPGGHQQPVLLIFLTTDIYMCLPVLIIFHYSLVAELVSFVNGWQEDWQTHRHKAYMAQHLHITSANYAINYSVNRLGIPAV